MLHPRRLTAGHTALIGEVGGEGGRAHWAQQPRPIPWLHPPAVSRRRLPALPRQPRPVSRLRVHNIPHPSPGLQGLRLRLPEVPGLAHLHPLPRLISGSRRLHALHRPSLRRLLGWHKRLPALPPGSLPSRHPHWALRGQRPQGAGRCPTIRAGRRRTGGGWGGSWRRCGAAGHCGRAQRHAWQVCCAGQVPAGRTSFADASCLGVAHCRISRNGFSCCRLAAQCQALLPSLRSLHPSVADIPGWCH